MTKRAMVIGGGVAGVQSAMDLAECGIEVTLVEESPSLHTNASNGESLLFMPRLLKAASHPNISLMTNASVERIRGEKGDFKVRIVARPRYVNPELCTSCGKCENECPVNIIPLSAHVQDSKKAIHRPYFGVKSVPSSYSVDKLGIPPCTAACPAEINAHGYVALIAQGKFAEALDLITDSVPFPRVLGRVCNHPCEDKCTRGKVDKPVAICALKRFIADNNSTESSLQRSHKDNGVKLSGPASVAIIGAGPAGLTAARDLARLGHRSTVFEALPAPGGMITVGMPRFRLPREVRQADIDDIVRLGIEIRTSTPIGKDLTLEDLKRQGYEAILIAVGAHKNQRLGILGEGLSGVMNSITLLEALNLKKPVSVGSRVVVIGSGYTGIDSARTAIRLHCERVVVVDRCAREDLPANPEEVAEAESEGVKFEYLVAPVRIVGKDGKVAGVELRRMQVTEPETGGGRRHTIPTEGSEFFVEADTVIVAAGQRPDLSFLEGDTTLNEGRKHIVTDPATTATKIPGIFAAGDAAHECGPMINAIAAGRRAAISIDKYLRGEEVTREPTHGRITPVEANPDDIYVTPIKRQQMPLLPFKDRIGNFEEVELGFTEEMATMEAQRCLNCGICSECLECERACELNAVAHSSLPERIDMEVAAIIATEIPLPERNAAQPGDDISETSTPAITAHPGVYTMLPDSDDGDVSRASALAARVMVDMAEYRRVSGDVHRIKQEVISGVPSVQRPASHERRAGVFICGCGGSISDVVDIPSVVDYCHGLDGIVYSGRIGYACTDEAAEEIRGIAERQNLTHVVLAACSCCNLDQICFSCSDRRIRCKVSLLGENGSDNTSYEFVNIREHCAWVHHGRPDEATAKAKVLIKAGIARTCNGHLPAIRPINIEQSVLVIGAGTSGMQAATSISAQGFPVTVINSGKQNESVSEIESRLEKSVTSILYGAELLDIGGTVGDYRAVVNQDGKQFSITAGAIIVDLNTANEAAELPSLLHRAWKNNGHITGFPEPAVSRLPGVFLCGISQDIMDENEASIQGAAAAAKASILLNKGAIDTRQTAAYVDEQRCRGCGTCVSICPFTAATLNEKSPDVFTAQVDEGLCCGCGICVAHCPSGALNQGGFEDSRIISSLEAILS